MQEDTSARSFQEGKRMGLAIAAVAASVVAFVSMLGLEKAVLAIVLAILAGRGALRQSRSRRLSMLALGIAALYLLTFALIMILFHEKLGEFVRLLQQMS